MSQESAEFDSYVTQKNHQRIKDLLERYGEPQ